MYNYRSLPLRKQVKYSLLLHLVAVVSMVCVLTYANWSATDNWDRSTTDGHNSKAHDSFTSKVR